MFFQIQVVKLRGLPWETTKQQICDWIEKHGAGRVDITNVQLVMDHSQRASGDSLVKFNSREDAEQAQNTLHKKDLGGRYVEVFLDGFSPDGRRDFRKGQTIQMAKGFVGGKGKWGDTWGKDSWGKDTWGTKGSWENLSKGGGDWGGGKWGGQGGKYGADKGVTPYGSTGKWGAPSPYGKGGYEPSYGKGYETKGSYGYDAKGYDPKGGYKGAAPGAPVGERRSFYQWLKVRGLPFEASEDDVVDFLTGQRYGIQSKDVLIEKNGIDMGFRAKMC